MWSYEENKNNSFALAIVSWTTSEGKIRHCTKWMWRMWRKTNSNDILAIRLISSASLLFYRRNSYTTHSTPFLDSVNYWPDHTHSSVSSTDGERNFREQSDCRFWCWMWSCERSLCHKTFFPLSFSMHKTLAHTMIWWKLKRRRRVYNTFNKWNGKSRTKWLKEMTEETRMHALNSNGLRFHFIPFFIFAFIVIQRVLSIPFVCRFGMDFEI